MNPLFRIAVALAGALVLAWVGAGYAAGHPLALALTALIGAFYLGGLVELRRFDRATSALEQALASTLHAPATLEAWLDTLPAALRPGVRRRVEGEAVALPGPALAPSLAGLLVLLGMLGTFVGMVLTLRGTGTALESASDLAAVRDSLVAPVKGLGLAFGTSVAGVAASAALGLVASLCRHQRTRVAQRLDGLAATTLRGFSRQHQRELALALLQRQAELLPGVVNGLGTLMQALQQQAEQSNERLLASQQQFLQQAAQAHGALAASVEQSLQASLAAGARSTAEAVQAVATRTLEGLAGTFEARSATLLDSVALHFDQQSQSLLKSLALAQADLVRVAAEAPRAAAQLVGELRQQLSTSLARDNQALEQHSHLLRTAETMLGGVNRATAEQRQAIDTLVASARMLLEQAGQRHAEQLETQGARIDGLALQAGAGAIEMASLGEAFGLALQQFSQSNDRLGAQLQRIESALGQAMTRSDDQLAYSVAQAREVIDLSVLSQKQIVDELQRLAGRNEAMAT